MCGVIFPSNVIVANQKKVQLIYDITLVSVRALCIKCMKFGVVMQLTKGNIFDYECVTTVPPYLKMFHFARCVK